MRTCTEPCSRGFNSGLRCCRDCQLKELCEHRCKYENLCTPIEPRPRVRKDRIAKKFRKTNILILIAIALIIFFGLIIIGLLNEIFVMSVDNLNMAQMSNQEQKDAASEDLTAPRYILTAEERELVERVVAAESRGEDLQGQMAVAQTILDRSELWNMTVNEVLTAPDQYAKPYQGEISDETKLAVANVFDGGIRVFEEPITHFYTGAEPYWAEEKVNRGSIGRHNFLY